MAGEGVVESEEGGGSLVCGSGEENALPGNTPSSRLPTFERIGRFGRGGCVVVAVGAVVAGKSSEAESVDGE
jgi:hypothetical protein